MGKTTGKNHFVVLLIVLVLVTLACNLSAEAPTTNPGNGSATNVSGGNPGGATGGASGGAGGTNGVTARVIRVIDGDTIDVELGGQEYRVRYVGVNTPERDEECYAEARAANERLVSGQTVRMEADVSDTDRYDRLLRYIYVGDTFVNAELIRQGVAEVVLYEPDDREFDFFRALEREAQQANRGCHPTGIFADRTFER
ncbi:MAG: thermonuclease family protein [bacterium]|nr:thermonuclease family protein [bacterium]